MLALEIGNMEEQVLSLSNIEVDGEQYYLLANQVHGEQDGISLTLTDGKGAWIGHISQDDMKGLSEVVSMKLEDFTEQTLNALTQQEMTGLRFQYDVKNSDLDKIFSWKKVMASAEIKYQLGSVKLTAVDNTKVATQELFTFAIDQMKMLRENIRGLEKENDRLSRERRKALQLLDKLTRAKQNLENDLYSKFQVVVNDKKAKIRQLQKDLNEVNPENDGERKQRRDTKESDSSGHQQEEADDEEMDTDDEMRNIEEQQQSKKLKVDRLENDSLLLDDDEDESTTTTGSSRRRIRKTATKKVPEPASSVILSTKATKQTLNRTPSTSKNVLKTPQSRRTGSSRSNQSDPDPDDLFSEL